jgi:hypothetical protein
MGETPKNREIAIRCLYVGLSRRPVRSSQMYWAGDDVLADQLDALQGTGALPDLRPLPVDLDELAGILEGDPMYGAVA